MPAPGSSDLLQEWALYATTDVSYRDGAEALPQQVGPHVPEHTLVLDVIQATEYLWDTANLLLGETHPHSTVQVRSSPEPLVAGQAEAVLAALEAEADEPTYTAPQRRAVRLNGHWDRLTGHSSSLSGAVQTD